ncbi:hypothetical protein Cph01nite_05020 [Cellulomonas phragmiteti]|uniref:Uncharacterized protein n=1 Tax=Cellulomonas phragmiteti TaxID=478780 RepID=A0ABQ4DHD6_9CELL|nr:hypothetical protein Cph01nite_05020 [Cellulomonas phragmiteti]
MPVTVPVTVPVPGAELRTPVPAPAERRAPEPGVAARGVGAVDDEAVDAVGPPDHAAWCSAVDPSRSTPRSQVEEIVVDCGFLVVLGGGLGPARGPGGALRATADSSQGAGRAQRCGGGGLRRRRAPDVRRRPR